MQKFILFTLMMSLIAVPVLATEVAIMNWNVPGDGKTPTFLQYLNDQTHDIKEVKGLASATAKGEATYSLDIALPPAVLKPALSLQYSSETGMSVETPVGWAIGGIAEIRRPLSNAYTTKDKDKWYSAEWLVSGKGFSGTLKPSGEDDYRFFMHAVGGVYVVAKYDAGSDSWMLYHDGIAYRLDPADSGSSTAVGTAWWRVTTMEDGSGNVVTCAYHAGGSLKSISYGGNNSTEDPLIRVDFTYATNAAKHTTARAGFLTEYKHHLTKITINTLSPSPMAKDFVTVQPGRRAGPALQLTATRTYAYVLGYTKTDSLDLLTSLKREGTTSAVSELLVKFTYSAISTSGKPARTSTTGPKSLGESSSSTPGEYKDTTSTTNVSLIDVNRDGLPDVIDDFEGNDQRWIVYPQSVNASARTFSWSGPFVINSSATGESFEGGLGMVTTTYAKWHNATSYARTQRQFVDFDGDGYVDILYSGDKAQWIVYFGNKDHVYGEASSDSYMTMNPPGMLTAEAWTYSQVNLAVHANNATPPTESTDEELGLLDLNGDGWLDAYDPEAGYVWYNKAARGSDDGGFETAHLMKSKFEALRSVKYTYASEVFKLDLENYCNSECEDQCEESDCDTDSCVEACEDSAEDTLEHYISFTDETKGFYDINGDGLPDFVDASVTPWQVSLGTGADFLSAVTWTAPAKYLHRTDEGHPDTEWMSTEYDIDQTDCGTTAKVYQTLLDVDGDGLLDLAIGKSLGKKWYKNTGSGFETSSRALPTWWPDSFVTSLSSSVTENDDEISTSTTKTLSMVMDIDHDGMLDAVTTDASGFEYVDSCLGFHTMAGEVTASGVKYGAYPKPYILTKIDNIQGGATDIAYRSLATVSPSGDYSKVQYTPDVKTLVDTLAVKDSLSSQTGGTSYTYADGYYDKGVFEGFGNRTVAQTVNGAFGGKTELTYALDRDFTPLVKQKKIYTDANLSFGSTIKRGASSSAKLRYEVNTSYTEQSGDTGVFYYPKTRTTTEYGEVTGSRKVIERFTWDNAGNLLTYTNDGAGVTDDAVKMAFEYVANAHPDDATFYRMTSKTVYGTDPLTAKYQGVAVEKYYYDGKTDATSYLDAGLLTRSETWAGWLGNGEVLNAEKLTVDYTRGSRGEITKVVDNATGRTMNQTFGFGGAVLKTQTNGLGQNLTGALDSLGRVTELRDDNGLAMQTAYDDFGRVIKMTAVGKDGADHVLSDTTYSRASAPYYTMTRTYNDSATADTTSYTIEDGLGGTAQSWTQAKNGKFLVTRQTNDVRGLTAKTNHPTEFGTFSTTAALNMPNTFTQTYHDALGIPREVIRDATIKTGSQLVYFDNPGEEIRKDENDYLAKLTHDARHRITQVDQGQTVTTTTTAKYRYDPLDRLVSFEDANGVTYKYSYDGAGRLRQVSYGNPSTKIADAIWYTYSYKGNLKTKMTDNSGAYSAWEYDVIGRPTKLTVTDGLPSATGTLDYTWSYDGATWIGAVSKTTDPSGSTSYTYDYLGREVRADRVYTAGSMGAPYAKFTYNYDLKGQVTSEKFPSRHKIDSTYTHGYLDTQKAVTGSASDYTLTYEYNNWGIMQSAASSLGHTFTNSYTTPLWSDAVALSYGTKTYKRGYTWLNDGLLATRTDSMTTSSTSSSGVDVLSSQSVVSAASLGSKAISNTSSPLAISRTASPLANMSTVYSYGYDLEKQITSVKTTLKTVESFTYDTAGNMTAMLDPTGVNWTYTPPKMPNMIAMRSKLNADNTKTTETYKFTDAGRLKTWISSAGTYAYYYDGLGRLRGVTLNGVWQMVLDYDADGALVRRGDGSPYEGTPYYKYSFRDWRYDETSKTETEFDNAFVSAEDGKRTWTFTEYDGHVAKNLDDSGTVTSSRTLGAYGSTVSSSGTAWDWQAFHGTEKQGDLYDMGQRHLMPGDGLWIQPEPMLYGGIPQDRLASPLSFAPYRYAENSPTVKKDTTGFADEDTQEYEESEIYARAYADTNPDSVSDIVTAVPMTMTDELENAFPTDPLQEATTAANNINPIISTSQHGSNGYTISTTAMLVSLADLKLDNRILNHTTLSNQITSVSNPEHLNTMSGHFSMTMNMVNLPGRAEFGPSFFNGFTLTTPGVLATPSTLPTYTPLSVNVGAGVGVSW